MPRGEVSHDQLSQLLFVYIGIASDIMELFILFNESYVIQDELITYIILGSWSLSLMQFTLVLTVTKGPKTRAIGIAPLSKPAENNGKGCNCCETEVWSILTSMFMQDAPFLSIRLYVMIKNRTLTYSILFFTFKNALILGMQFYRLVVVIGNHYGRKDDNGSQDIPKKASTATTIDIEISTDGETSPKSNRVGSNWDGSPRKKISRQEPNGVVKWTNNWSFDLTEFIGIFI